MSRRHVNLDKIRANDPEITNLIVYSEGQDFGAIADAMVDNTNVTHLSLGAGYSFNPLHRILTTKPQIHTLRLWDVSLNMGNCTILAAAITDSSITELGIDRCSNFDPEGFRILEVSLRIRIKSLYLVDVEEFYPEGTETIASLLTHSTVLEKLNYIRGDLRDEGIKIIAEALGGSSITSLNLAVNNMTERGFRHLLQNMPDSQIQVLELGENKIKLDTYTNLANDMRKCQILSLNLDSNYITPRGFAYLAEVIASTDLKLLGLYETGITDSAFTHIIDALSTNTSLETIQIQLNKLKRSTVSALVDVLERGGGSSLSEVTPIYAWDLPIDLKKRLENVLARNKHNITSREHSFFFGLLQMLGDNL